VQLELQLQPTRAAALSIAASPDDAWQGAIADWFRGATAEAWKSAKPALVVVPTRGQAQALKARLLEDGLSALGIEFVTPPNLRALLASRSETVPLAREHLRILLALAAEELLADETLPKAQQLAAISVRRTPEHLLRLLEQLRAAGADFQQLDLAAFGPVERKFRALLTKADGELLADIDRRALSHAKQHPPSIGHLLISGFHGAHWPLWHLLRAGVYAAENPTVVLQNPRIEAHDLDAAWIGTWEEALGEATPVAAKAEPLSGERQTLFLAGLDTREEVEAIVAATHQFLADENCRRVGIIVPGAGALPRLVSAALTRHRIAHYDAMGQMAPGIFEATAFQSWIELQRTPRLAALLHFLTALERDHPLFEKISREKIAAGLQKALGALAIDDLDILIASARGRESKGELLSAALDQIRFLPAKATFAEFLTATREAFERLGWYERWREIEHRGDWTTQLRTPFARTIYLRWIEEIANTFRVTRDATGAHPYARVHLLTPAQAEDQTWSHLIFTSLNDGVWPGAPAGDFLPAQQIDAINQSTRQLNRTTTRRGSQGEGHVAVREGRALFVGALQRRQLSEAQFESLLENATHGVAFTASVIQENAPERIANPSEFLNRVYHAAHGQSLSQQEMRALRNTTRRWLDRAKLEPHVEFERTPGIRQTRVAYDQRRLIAPSNEYDFALTTRPRQVAPMSVSAFEEMLKAPALVWLKRYLGVEPEDDLSSVWESTTGKWTHEWLASLGERGENFVRLPSAEEIERRIRAAADRKRGEVQHLCRAAGRHLPDWWESAWQGALCVSLTLGRALATAKGWPWMATEWRFESQPIDVGHDLRLFLTGRADLLLAQTSSAPTALDVPELWIIDFKTGNKDPLTKGMSNPDVRVDKTRQKLLKGDALQLGLYAKAAQPCGAENIHVSLVSPLVGAAEPQLSLGDFEKCETAFQELARMQATGVFGFKGSLRNPFAYTKPYPLAMLAVDRDLADERWELTHPGLAVEGNYWR
jgi:hypothetical protein